MPLLRNTPSTAGNSRTGSERPSPETLLKKEASPAVPGGDNSGNAPDASMSWIIGLGGSQPYSRGEFQEMLWERFRGLSGIIPEFLPESPSRTGGVAHLLTSLRELSLLMESRVCCRKAACQDISKVRPYPLTQNCYLRKLLWNNYFQKITNLTRNSLKMSFCPGHSESTKSLKNYEK